MTRCPDAWAVVAVRVVKPGLDLRDNSRLRADLGMDALDLIDLSLIIEGRCGIPDLRLDDIMTPDCTVERLISHVEQLAA